ncbi:MAG TPA: hypothetical protein VF650_08910 [Allosphingosinicella sp.]|jgi:hypothetical protein
MSEELHNVAFDDAEVGNLTGMLVTREQARTILAAAEGEEVCLGEERFIRLQRSSDPGRTGPRVFHYRHGERGGHGYVLAREADLRKRLRRILRG